MKLKHRMILHLIASLLFLIFFVNQAYALETVDISEVPQRIADALGITLFAGQLIASSLILALFLFPTFIFTRGKDLFSVMVISFLAMGICVGLEWLPYWFLLVTSLIVALLFGARIRDWITGK